MDNVQNCDSCINIPPLQIYRSYCLVSYPRMDPDIYPSLGRHLNPAPSGYAAGEVTKYAVSDCQSFI
jgi:hypothetical protein